jgi:hypothetical protein
VEHLCDSDELLTIFYYLRRILTLIQILIPIGLIIWGTIDLGKAVIAGDEKEIKANQQTLLKRVIAAILVFFVVVIVGFVMGFVGNKEWDTCWRASKNHDPDLGNPVKSK